MSDWHFCACCGPLFDYKLAHVSFQMLFLLMDHLVKVSLKNWYTFLLQKTPATLERFRQLRAGQFKTLRFSRGHQDA
jgi:hypothetical protein